MAFVFSSPRLFSTAVHDLRFKLGPSSNPTICQQSNALKGHNTNVRIVKYGSLRASDKLTQFGFTGRQSVCTFVCEATASPIPPNISNTSTLLLQKKLDKGCSFEDLGKQIGRSEVWVAALVYGQAKASREEAEALGQYLGIAAEDLQSLWAEFPTKGALGPAVPTDPFLYRLYEIVLVYGFPLKALIQEKFGDGIMSAIDFEMHVSKVQKQSADYVQIRMEGKFLPYKKW